MLIARRPYQLLPAADAEMAPSILWMAAIQVVQRKQDLGDLAPESCFVSAEAIECEVRKIGETQKATGEISGRIDGRFSGFRPGAGSGFW